MRIISDNGAREFQMERDQGRAMVSFVPVQVFLAMKTVLILVKWGAMSGFCTSSTVPVASIESQNGTSSCSDSRTQVSTTDHISLHRTSVAI